MIRTLLYDQNEDLHLFHNDLLQINQAGITFSQNLHLIC
jgi:hypothetical protein